MANCAKEEPIAFDAPLPETAEETRSLRTELTQKKNDWKPIVAAAAAVAVLIVGGVLIAHFLHKAAEAKKAAVNQVEISNWDLPEQANNGGSSDTIPGNSPLQTKELPDWYPDDIASFREYADPNAPALRDDADVFTDSEEGAIEIKLRELRAKYNADFCVFTDKSTYGFDRSTYSADYYIFTHHGVGDDLNGMVFFLSMEPGNKGWYTNATGSCMRLFTMDALCQIDDRLEQYMVGGRYGEGVLDYLDSIDALFGSADKAKQNEAAKTAFQEVINQYQGACALRDWTGTDAQRKAYPYVNSRMMEYYFSYCSSTFCYALVDLNSDGVTELLIGEKPVDNNEIRLIGLLSFFDGKVKKLIDDTTLGDRSGAEIYRDGTIHEYVSNGSSSSSYYWRVSEDGSPILLNSYNGSASVVPNSEFSWYQVADKKTQENIVGTWILYEDLNKDVPLGEDVGKYGAILYLTNRNQILYYVGKEWKTGTYTYTGREITAELKQNDSWDSSRAIGTESLYVTWMDDDLVIESSYHGYTLRWSRTVTGSPTLPTYESVYPTNVTVQNELPTRIVGFYIIPSTSTGWGSPVNSDTVSIGGKLELNRSVLTAGNTAYDIGIVGEDMLQYFVFGIPLSVGDTVTMSASGDTVTAAVNGVKYTGTVRDFAHVTVQNDLPASIQSLYITTPSNTTWGTPVNSGSIGAGRTAKIDSSALVDGDTTYDLMVVNANNWRYEFLGVSVSAGDTISFSTNGEKVFAIINGVTYTGMAYDGNKADEPSEPEPTESAPAETTPPAEPSPAETDDGGETSGNTTP